MSLSNQTFGLSLLNRELPRVPQSPITLSIPWIMQTDTPMEQLKLLSITNCMNDGYPRWQSQYLHKFVMPDVKSISEELSSRMLAAYRQSNVDGINVVMKDIIKQPRKKTCRTQQAGAQLSLGV